MKRLLSWIVLAACDYGVCIGLSFLCNLVYRLVLLVYRESAFLFWALVFLAGTAVLGGMLAIVFYAGQLMIALSEKIKPTKRGSRYVVVGVISIVSAIIWLTLMAFDILIAAYVTPAIAYWVEEILLGAYLIFAGKFRRKDVLEA